MKNKKITFLSLVSAIFLSIIIASIYDHEISGWTCSTYPKSIQIPQTIFAFITINGLIIAFTVISLAYLAIKRKISQSFGYLLLRIALFTLIFNICSFFFSNTGIYLNWQTARKIDKISIELENYYRRNNVFPSSLDEAAINDYLFINISPLTVSYSLEGDPTPNGETAVNLALLGTENRIFSPAVYLREGISKEEYDYYFPSNRPSFYNKPPPCSWLEIVK